MERLCVVMCVYNGEDFLEEQLASVAAQTRLPDSMIILDDRSHDGTPAIAEAFAARVPFPARVVRNQTNLGFIRNFEQGVTMAEGEVIVFADQDDVWHESRLESIGRAFAEAPAAAMVFSDAELVDAALRPLSCRLSEAVGFTPAMQRLVREDRLFEVLIRGNVVTGATLAFRSSFRELVLPLIDGVEHDAWIAFLLSAVAPAIFLDQPLLLYRQHAQNQIGARRLGALARLQGARRSRVEGLVRQQVRNTRAQERLSSVDLPRARREMLREATAHLAVRSALPGRRVQRVVPVLREIASGRYRRMSHGFRSACRDLLA